MSGIKTHKTMKISTLILLLSVSPISLAGDGDGIEPPKQQSSDTLGSIVIMLCENLSLDCEEITPSNISDNEEVATPSEPE